MSYFIIVIISALALFTSCNNEKALLLESVTYSDGRFEKYEYDNENRVTKTSHYDKDEGLFYSKTITYSGSDFIKVEMASGVDTDFFATSEYSISGNKIIVTLKNNGNDNIDTISVDLDNNGFPIKCEAKNDISSSYVLLEIHDGNLMRNSYKTIHDGVTLEGSSEFKYDDKKSPFYHCTTPKWLWILSDNYISTQNNVIEMSNSKGLKVEYKYEFNKAGYPIKCTAKGSNTDYVSEFKYKRKATF